MAFNDELTEKLAWLAKRLGLKPTDLQRLEHLHDKLLQDQRNNEDSLQALKEQIRTVETRARNLKAKYDNAHGGERRILAREIEIEVRRLDQARQKEDRIVGNLDKIAMALERIDVMRVQGPDSAVFDELSGRLAEVYDEVADTDQAARDLDKIKYPTQSIPTDAEASISRMERDTTLSDDAMRLFEDLGIDSKPKQKDKAQDPE